MKAGSSPPFRAEVVGSLLRPAALLEARQRRKRNEIDADELRRIEDDAIRRAVALQEEAGLRVVTDGEFRRELWHMDFLVRIGNVRMVESFIKVHFHSDAGDIEFQPPGLRVVGRLYRPEPIFVGDFEFLKTVTRVTPKQTIPSPSNLHFRGGRAAIDAGAYPQMPEFFADLARVYREEIAGFAVAGCRYLQIDEVNFAYLCDPKLREEVRATIGEDPAALPKLYASLINESIAGRPKDMIVGLHLCRGNAYSNWMAEGGYEPVAETLFNEVAVDGFFLEYDTPRAGDFRPLRFVPPDKWVVLGLLTTKHGRLESKDDLKRRIDEAARYVPIERLALSPQCGFASGAAGNKLTEADQIAKLRRVVEVAREVWGA